VAITRSDFCQGLASDYPIRYPPRVGCLSRHPCLAAIPATSPNPVQRVSFFLKSENRIEFPAAPHDAYRMPLPDRGLADDELILRLEVRQFPLFEQLDKYRTLPSQSF
jgi:hypothetical protein